jgi:hypothetical protein
MMENEFDKMFDAVRKEVVNHIIKVPQGVIDFAERTSSVDSKNPEHMKYLQACSVVAFLHNMDALSEGHGNVALDCFRAIYGIEITVKDVEEMKAISKEVDTQNVH